ncbi:hypothetical protein HHK36_018097 [Tetracentron sinense]|uniref:Uncharacterized protein n=1 Tax=Tetracentron sinense TaxID=13715 RepID=A0A834YVA3_TETSI|nr:hypothetical protein HHK36_018097 [Tetracentron sinense]
MAGIVVVFDFDETIIECDSDDLVVQELGDTQLFNELLPTLPFHILMDRMMGEIHSQGKTIKDIAECLKRAPLHPRIIAAIKSAHALGCDLRIISDANTFFIETVLKHYGLMDYFSEINTNPCLIDEEGKLRILPYHDSTSTPHGCSLCPSNMCKGLVIERIQASASVEGKKRIIYLGDGRGDFCPSLKLWEGDYMMPRKNFPVWELICGNPMLMKAEVHEWSDGEELERVLLHLINMISIEENSNSNYTQLVSLDCKFETIPTSTHENSVLRPPQLLTVGKELNALAK